MTAEGAFLKLVKEFLPFSLYFLLNKQVIHNYCVKKTSAILIVSQSVGSNEHRMDNCASTYHFREHNLAMGQFPFIRLSHLEIVTAELHLAHINDIILATD